MIFRYKIEIISDIEQKIRKLLVNIAVAPFVGVWVEIFLGCCLWLVETNQNSCWKIWGFFRRLFFYFVGFSFYLVYIGRSSDGFNKDYLRKDE